MLIQIDTAKAWMKVAGFCYRRAASTNGREPDGVPGRRSPDYPCSGYEPREREPGDWDDCESDGHYLCAGCCHKITDHDLSKLEEARAAG